MLGPRRGSSPTRRSGSWCAKFGLRNTRAGCAAANPDPAGKWRFDEVFVQIDGRRQYLWRAVDQDGNVLDILVQPRRDAKAAKRFFRKLARRGSAVSWVLVTDKLRSYAVAHREVMPWVEHQAVEVLDNRAENSHQPYRNASGR